MCVGGCAVIQAHCVKQYFLLFFGEVGEFHGGAECDNALVNLVKQFGDKVSQTDIAEYLVTAFIL